jgi:HEAT repeat protein
MRRLVLVGFIALFALPACDDRSYRDIGAAIDVLTKKKHELPGPAIERLRKLGRRAVPQIETALHTAPPRGKVNLVAALAAIGEPESTAILQHFAVYDSHADVRAACEEVLAKWASGNDGRSQPAKLALARIEEKRKLGHAE